MLAELVQDESMRETCIRWSEAGQLAWPRVTFYKIFKPKPYTTMWNNEQGFPKIKLILLEIFWRWSNAIT